ncbi:hypothetical protein [Francisella marina]|uniref:Tail fiber protein n=1 Tax=Francisella marina TaxID=2249302 RepID=A0ABX5ZK18_9GAMM|nr:hypothetical protein [Francisella marina]QEO57548.1 hypothetical protein F0R74_06670 [Francisella marina]
MNKPTKKYVIFGESSSFGGNYGNSASTISLDEQFSTYASEWSNGMDLIDSNAGFPTIEDHGAIFAILSRFQKLYAKYLGFWNSEEEYVIGSWVIASDNNFYRSKTGTTAVPNVGNDPVSTPASWDSMASLIGGGSTLPNGSATGDILVWDSTANAGVGGYVSGTLPTASETVSGIQENATDAEAQAEALDNKSITPLKLGNYYESKKATDALVDAGVDDESFLTVAKASRMFQNIGFGQSQSYTDVTGSRSFSVTYTNTGSKPIFVVVNFFDSTGSGACRMDLLVNGANASVTVSQNGQGQSSYAIVPPSSTYRANIIFGVGGLTSWYELS